MKLINKIFLIIGLSWLSVLALTYAGYEILLINHFFGLQNGNINFNYFIVIFMTFAVLTALIILFFLHVFIRKDLDNIITDIKDIAKQNVIEKDDLERQAHLEQLADYDDLTALPNQVFFNEILNKSISHARRYNKTLAILIIDLDYHEDPTFNDVILKEMTRRFQSVLRTGDVMARLTSDDLIILLNDINQPKFAGSVAEKILHVCIQPIKINSHEATVIASIGISIFPDDGHSLEDLQMHADMAMYKAKQDGGNIYQYYKHEMNIIAHEHTKLEASLRMAIYNNEFVLYYQPQLNLIDGRITRVEALIRWNHPEYGLLPPAKFIPIAEETGFIMAIGEWALHEACRTNKAWQIAGYDPVTVIVNISPKQFRYQHLGKIVADVLNENNLDPKHLEIEITETAIIDNIHIAKNKLKSIYAMGVHVSIDDFGIGYTSINYLKQLPINTLKIDQTFIKGIPYNQNDAAITSGVIALGHNLGLNVVGEGVETAEQMKYLADHHCDLIQGYFISRPMPENKIVHLFTKSG